jgi:hypothetical protein
MNDAPASKRAKHGGGRAFHSRLEPYADFIREQRQRRKTWKEIADLLQTEKGCAITLSRRSPVLSVIGVTLNDWSARIGNPDIFALLPSRAPSVRFRFFASLS